MTSRPRSPTGRPRGRPPLTPEQREARRAERLDYHRARTDRQREGRVFRSLFLTPEQAQRLDELVELLGYAGAGALVEALIEAAPDVAPPSKE